MLRTAIRGYFAALAGGNVAFWTVGLLRAAVFGPHPDDGVGFLGFLIVAVFTFVASLATTLLPFIVFLAIALVLGVRSWVYFAICGAAMGFVTTGMLIGTRAEVWAVNPTMWQHLAISGGLGGLVFWRVAIMRRSEPPARGLAGDTPTRRRRAPQS